MRVIARAVWPAIRIMPREQPLDVAGSVSDKRHEGAAQGGDDHLPILKGDPVFRSQIDDEGVAASRNRLHQTQTTESAIANQQGTGNCFAKSKLHAPQRVFGESGTVCKKFGAHPRTVLDSPESPLL